MRIVSSVLASLLLAGSFVLAAPPVKFTTIERGQQSNIDDAKQVVVRTAADWGALWRLHNTAAPQPVVDFGPNIVVAVFLGSRPTGGFDVEITSIVAEGNTVTVTWRESRPERGAILSQVLTMPYHIVTIPRTAASVVFKKAA
jgi:hypothetical protein